MWCGNSVAIVPGRKSVRQPDTPPEHVRQAEQSHKDRSPHEANTGTSGGPVPHDRRLGLWGQHAFQSPAIGLGWPKPLVHFRTTASGGQLPSWDLAPLQPLSTGR